MPIFRKEKAQGVQEANNEETYFGWWIDDLIEAGLVLSTKTQTDSFVLRNPEPIYFDQIPKRGKPFIKSRNLFQPITYGCDREVIFHQNMLNKLFGIINNDKSLIPDTTLTSGNIYDNVLFFGTNDIVAVNSKNELEFTIYFDVKPTAKAARYSGNLGSSRDFVFKQRMLYDLHNIYVNKVIPIGNSTCLFAKTFTPSRYMFQDKRGGLRKINFPTRTLDSWLLSKNIEKPI